MQRKVDRVLLWEKLSVGRKKQLYPEVVSTLTNGINQVHIIFRK